jgi:hypothetical protein
MKVYLELGVPLALPVLHLCRTIRQKHWRSQWHPTLKPSFDKALAGTLAAVRVHRRERGLRDQRLMVELFG